MSQKKYWKGLEELHNTPAHQETVANEFKDSPLPFSDLSDSLLGATTPRRDFLKYLGFSTAAAMLAASCEMPVRKVIPYAIKPEDIVPGVPNYYASTFVDGGDYCPIIIKTRDGRPIKIEGNELSSITKGGTSARVQASVLSLYDAARLRQPYADGKKVDTFGPIDRMVMDGLAGGGKTIYILTGTILSPTVKEVIAQFIAKYPNAKHVVYDPMSFSGMLLANEASYGKRTLPSYHFDKAQTIVSLDADFLGTWLSPIEFARAYSNGRRISAKNLQMSKHYQIEGMQTLTGANADHRATTRPSQMGAVAVALYNAVVNGAAPQLESKHLNDTIVKAAADLKKGNGMVVCGTNNVAIQTVVNAINDKIGANGTTINWTVTSNYKQGIDADMVNLVADVKAGNVGALLMHGNPVYEYMDGVAFGESLKNVPVTVSFSDRMDETATLCKYVVPDHHFLESWGDAEPKPGYYSLMQPGIAPIFKTRAFADSLLTWAGSTTTYGDQWKSYWMGKLGGQEAFDQALQDGVIEPGGRSNAASTATVSTTTGEEDTTNNAGMRVMPAVNTTTSMAIGGAAFSGNVADAISKISAMKPASGKDVVIYQKVGIGHGGSWSNNPWLQELPDPITKATWDNYVCISPKYAKDLDANKGIELEVTSINEVDENKHLLKVTVNGKVMELPAVVVPGMHNDVIAIAVGYGRIKSVGRASADLGKNAYPLRAWNGQTFESTSTGATVEKLATTYPVAITQTHHSYEGRAIIREFTLADFSKEPDFLLKEREEEIGHYAHLPWVGHDEPNTGHGSAENGEQKAHQNTAIMTAPHGDGHVGDPDQPGAEAHHGDFEEGFRENGTLYPTYESPGIHWGMSIDLTACIGCGACVIGCQSENNVSVVGKNKVMKAQEMHWITIDRYFTGMPDEPDTIQTVFQPMLCQHCDNAPCENVCPVSATNHSSEGLNQMAYNRCIGTKYCANNCPYKVRHFNWMDWNGADCFDDNLYEDGRRDDMNDDLTRMVLNPDVTVRSRGVMEKCSFCVQRLQEGKLAAKKDGRPLRDGEVRTACQQACPTEAIVFGNVNDKNSAVYKLRHQQQQERKYYVLEEIHSLPNVNYLSKIRNTELVIGGTDRDGLMKESI